LCRSANTALREMHFVLLCAKSEPMRKYIFFLTLLYIVAACSTPDTPKRQFVDVAGIDQSIKPGDNFFLHVNGKWYDTAQIAADQVGVGSYSFLNIPQRVKLQHILDSVSSNQNAVGSIEQKTGDFYASGLDTTTINQRGYEPIKPILDRADAIKDVASLMTFVATEQKKGNQSIISFSVSPDDKNSSINMAHSYQTGIGLPDRDYYFKTDSSSVRIQNAYKKYLSELFQLTGVDASAAARNAETVYNIEKQIASSHKTNIERRDVKANYNKLAIADLNRKQSNIGWAKLMENLGAKVDSIDIGQPAYYEKLNSLLKSVSINDWKVYLKANTLTNYADALSKPFVDASFEFTKVVSGQARQKTRQQTMVETVNRYLGQDLAQLYVKKYFNEDAKKRVLDLVNNLQKAMEVRMDNLDWMSDSTKVKAKEKLYTITKKIGYPDKWREYNVQIDRTKYFENVLALNQNDYNFQLNKLNKPVDKTEWGATPPTVTAYYNPAYNEIVFPAGILQFPYFDFEADDALNYGGIGMVIGHEITHAFDDQGAQYDKDGNVKDWWTAEDYAKFRERGNQMAERYSTFIVLDSVHVKGPLTNGENIADNAGVAMAYDAFKLTEQGKGNEKIDGYTPDQRFFLSIARIWRVKTRDEFLRNYVNTNPHSPAMWRVNGPLMNFGPFYDAFDVKPGDKNYKSEEDRIMIW
jgi:putative endopeptidase